jgi:Kef-type K+ transport system membrane component KefB
MHISSAHIFYKGSMAMGAAALNDAAAWCLLVLAISLGQIISLQTDNTFIYPSIKPAFVSMD